MRLLKTDEKGNFTSRKPVSEGECDNCHHDTWTKTEMVVIGKDDKLQDIVQERPLQQQKEPCTCFCHLEFKQVEHSMFTKK